jgi:hypothetical protein
VVSLSQDARWSASSSGRGLPLLVAVYRLGVAVLTAVALAFTAYRANLSGGLGNFFSFFTILSNILGTLVFFAAVAAVASGRPGAPDLLRGAAALYLVITGIVYGIALAHYDTPQVIPWVNIVVHRVTPAVFAADWLIDPPRRPPRFPRALVWLVFPVLYLLYTLVRGPVVGWYPYPFLDPRTHGYAAVAVGCVLVAAAFLAVSALLCAVAARLRGRAEARIASDNRRR